MTSPHPDAAQFTLIDAVWTGENREACLAPDTGACWAFVEARLPQFIYGRYPLEERWRVDIVYIIGLAALVPMLVYAVLGSSRAGLDKIEKRLPQ